MVKAHHFWFACSTARNCQGVIEAQMGDHLDFCLLLIGAQSSSLTCHTII